MSTRLLSGLAAAMLLASPAWAETAPADVPLTAEQVRLLPPAAFDHHLHIFGPAAQTAMRKILERYPEAAAQMDPEVTNIRTRQGALDQLDRAGISGGALLSAAYMPGSPMIQLPDREVKRLTREENRYNVDAAIGSKGRLLAFISVNPLRADAIAEMRYWAGRRGVTGLKLHFANSGFDWSSESDIRKAAAVVAEARRLRLPIIAHLRNGPGYDPRIFITRILPGAGTLPVQIAHIAGFGGIGSETIGALSAFADAVERGAPGTTHLIFDLSAVDLAAAERAPAGSVQAPLEERRGVVALMRKIGLDRFVMGSDWPGLTTVAHHNAVLEASLPLTAEEWRIVLLNRAPYAIKQPRH